MEATRFPRIFVSKLASMLMNLSSDWSAKIEIKATSKQKSIIKLKSLEFNWNIKLIFELSCEYNSNW